MRKKWRRFAGLSLLNLVFLAICLATLVPIAYAVTLSFSGTGAALSSGFSFFPKNPTLENYRAILVDEPFLRWFMNSLGLAGCTMVLAIGCGIFAAYGFSRYKFRGRAAVLKLLLLLNAFPQILSLFALFRLLKTMGMLNQWGGLVLIYAGGMCVFSIWNLKGYFDSIPVEIEEASKIDGANDLQMIWKVILPLARPAIIVTCVMVLISVWNEYLFAITFLINRDTYSLAGGLYQMQTNDYSRNWPLFSAASVLVSVPVLLIFFRIQKYMVSGLTAGGVKG